MAELADALGSGPSSPKECGFKSHRRYQFILPNVLRVWHNGCAPAFQAGHGGSTPPTRSNYAVVEFPSGQRGQTVNLLSPTSMVRIHLPPPFLTIQHLNFEVLFLLSKKWSGKMDFSASAENYTAVRYIEPGWFDHGSLLPGCVSIAGCKPRSARQSILLNITNSPQN